jgi:hypothetical protein
VCCGREALLQSLIARLVKLLTRRLVLVGDTGRTYLAEPDADRDEARTLRPLQSAALACCIAFGPRDGHTVFTLRGAMPHEGNGAAGCGWMHSVRRAWGSATLPVRLRRREVRKGALSVSVVRVIAHGGMGTFTLRAAAGMRTGPGPASVRSPDGAIAFTSQRATTDPKNSLLRQGK